MRVAVILTVIAMLIILAGCGGNIDAKPLKTPTNAAVAEVIPEPQPEVEESPGKTAAEAIKELSIPLPEPKQTKGGASLYPDAPEGVTGVDALKARTKALYTQGSSPGNVEADREFGARYGDESDLPEGYGDDGSAGEE